MLISDYAIHAIREIIPVTMYQVHRKASYKTVLFVLEYWSMGRDMKFFNFRKNKFL